MKVLNPYQEWDGPLFHQAPVVQFYREEKKSNKRNPYERDRDSQMDSHYVPYSDFKK
jgi:hypothetical protein